MKEPPSAILFFLRTSLNKARLFPATSTFGLWPAAYTEAFPRTRLKTLVPSALCTGSSRGRVVKAMD